MNLLLLTTTNTTTATATATATAATTTTTDPERCDGMTESLLLLLNVLQSRQNETTVW